MSRISHQPQALHWRAGGKAKGTKGRNPLTNTTNNSLVSPGEVGKGARRSGFQVDNMVWRQVKKLA
jgi:hypothetical protein